MRVPLHSNKLTMNCKLLTERFPKKPPFTHNYLSRRKKISNAENYPKHPDQKPDKLNSNQAFFVKPSGNASTTAKKIKSKLDIFL